MLFRSEPGPRRYEVVLPLASPAGGAWRITLPEALPTRCLSLVARGLALSAVALRSPLDDGPGALRELALAAGRESGDDAARLLVELGPAGVAALAESLPTMTAAGARRAIGLLAAVPGAAVEISSPNKRSNSSPRALRTKSHCSP